MRKIPYACIVGPIELGVNINYEISEISNLELYIDDVLIDTLFDLPYIYNWSSFSFSKHTVKLIGYFKNEEILLDEIQTFNSYKIQIIRCNHRF